MIHSQLEQSLINVVRDLQEIPEIQGKTGLYLEQALREPRVLPAFQQAYQIVERAVTQASLLEPKIKKARLYLNGGGQVGALTYAVALLEESLHTSPTQAVIRFANYFSQSDFIVEQTIYLAGVSCSDSITVTENISIKPFSREWSELRKIPWFLQAHQEIRLFASVGLILTTRHVHPTVFLEAVPSSPVSVLPAANDFSELEDLMLCLTAVGPCGPAIVATSIAPQEFLPGVRDGIGKCPIAVEIKGGHEFTPEKLENVAELYRAFQLLPPKLTRRLRVALRRLGLAMRRHWSVDAAIDIGIALEALLGDDRPNDASITMTLRLRGSRLLGRNLEERLQISELLSSIYVVRSKAVHIGMLPEEVKGMKSNDVLARGANLLAQLARHLILNGEPQWDNLLFG